MHNSGARRIRPRRLPINHRDVMAMPSQRGGNRQPHRPSTHHQHLGHGYPKRSNTIRRHRRDESRRRQLWANASPRLKANDRSRGKLTVGSVQPWATTSEEWPIRKLTSAPTFATWRTKPPPRCASGASWGLARGGSTSAATKPNESSALAACVPPWFPGARKTGHAQPDPWGGAVWQLDRGVYDVTVRVDAGGRRHGTHP